LSWLRAPRPTRLNWQRSRHIKPADSRYNCGTFGGQVRSTGPAIQQNPGPWKSFSR
jgi:hypothetical protein